MEEMQKAFNKTVVKLQNTSRIAEEQVSRASVRVSSENSSRWSRDRWMFVTPPPPRISDRPSPSSCSRVSWRT